jgi:hypothetical protein
MKNFRISKIVWLVILTLTSCANPPSGQIGISPTECTLSVGDQKSFSLDGILADNAIITWKADRGSITSTGQGLNAIFTAPDTPGDANISAIISSSTPIPLTRTCHVASQSTSTNNSIPTSTDDPPLLSNSNVPPTNALPSTEKTVIISEVMGNPCGGDEFRKWNDYVELYNSGDQPVDVGGWWLTVNGPGNKSDRLVSWQMRNPNIAIINQVVTTNTTQIPAHSFAVVLSPSYNQGLDPHRMPYRFPKETTILTIAEGDRIGHPVFGIVGAGGGRSVVVLYLGGAKSIQKIMSTYGTPTMVRYPQDVRDDRNDSLPLDLHTCASAERVEPLAPDAFEQWHEIINGSPGEAPYP